ncbi:MULTISPECIES: MFS transporter [unclassified Burkholderia]|uniref:MFS transporter n=1 Tax=unclassified Burkholderia TaxID=2613784 RepID=UPI0004682CCD|nr:MULTISPECIES: MFS transporter [unclassified Burkholderia]NIF72677.1 MFS transporter [Burkholderia sp. Ap-962]NIF96234.1 MFS transporter [Burkholderia sp. Ax-1720]
MSRCTLAPSPTAAAWQRFSTRAGFFSFGFMLSSWAPLAALAKSRIGLDDSAFGLALLWFGIGSLIAMPLGSAAASRLGCRFINLGFGPLACACLFALASTDDARMLSLSLFLFGCGIGTLESAMNLQAAAVQRLHAAPLMSGFHAWFSIGAIAGSAGVSSLLSLRVPPPGAVACVAAVMLVLWLLAGRHFIGRIASGERAAWRLPTRAVVWIGVLCFVIFLAEGAVLDWSGVFLTTRKAFSPAHAGYGYAAFAAAMAVGRLGGDRLAGAVGARRILLAGSLAAGASLIALVWLDHWLVLMLLFATLGLGLANLVPLLFLQISRQTRMPVELAMPVAATLGYAGMLAGPAILGSIAQTAGLPAAFAIVAALLLLVAASSRVVTPG